MSSVPLHYADFHGGFNTKAGPFLVEDTQARDVNNIQGTPAGSIVKRNGLVTFATPAVTLTSLAPAEQITPGEMIATGGTAMYSINASGTIVSIKTALTNNARWEFVSGPVVGGQGPIYGMNGVDTPQQWTGSASTGAWTATDAGGAVPNGKYAIYAQNQVFVAGTAANPSRVYFSAIGDPTGWNPANDLGAGFLDFDPNDGQVITGLGTVGPYVLVCKNRKLFVVTQPGNVAVAAVVRRLSQNVGCVAHRSIAQDSTGTYFLAEDQNVYVTNGSKITPIADVIQPTINQITDRTLAVGVCFDSHYYLSVPMNGSSNDTTLDWDTTLESWWKHTFGSNQFAISHPFRDSADLFSAKATAAIVDQCFVQGIFTDNGSNMTWSWLGPWQSPAFYRRRLYPTPYYRKNLRQFRADGSGRVDFSLAKDFQGGSILLQSDVFVAASGDYTWGTGTFGGSGFFGPQTASRFRQFSLGVANAFSVVFSATGSDPGIVYTYTYFITDRKDLVPT